MIEPLKVSPPPKVDIDKALEQQIAEMQRNSLHCGVAHSIFGVDLASGTPDQTVLNLQAQSGLTAEKLSEMLKQVRSSSYWYEPTPPKSPHELAMDRLAALERRLEELTRYVEYNAAHTPRTLEQYRRIQDVTAKITAATGDQA